MERRYTSVPVEFVEARDGQNTGTFSGLASVYYNKEDRGTEFVLWERNGSKAVERILPGAFDKALSRQDDVIALFNHDRNWPLADTSTGLTLRSEARGLRYTFPYREDDPQHQTMRAKTRPPAIVRESSFAFTVIDDDGEYWTREGDVDVRYIKSVQLHDVSMVTRGAYSSTDTGMRSSNSAEDAKASFERYQTNIRIEKINKLKAEV